MPGAFVVAVLVGVVQGILEWLPVSSQGGVALLGVFIADLDPAAAVDLALFVHLGTVLAATAYYRDTLPRVMGAARPGSPDVGTERDRGDVVFLGLATVATAVVGIPTYFVLYTAVSGLSGGGFLALIGLLLIGTGLLQLSDGGTDRARRRTPLAVDALLVGGLQGLAVLPGVSRSGVTIGALLLRDYEAPSALRLSYLLSIPASLGAAVLVTVASGGVPAVAPGVALVAILVSALIGYLTIDALTTAAARVPFWAVCVGTGGLAVAGGLLVL